MVFKLILVTVMIYLFLVFRVYSLTLYYIEFDKVRKYVWYAPFVTVGLFIYAILKKQSNVMSCFVFHLPTTYKLIGIEYCLLRKEYQPKKKIAHSKHYKIDQSMKVLLQKTEKFLYEC